jgi:hypothetical protein
LDHSTSPNRDTSWASFEKSVNTPWLPNDRDWQTIIDLVATAVYNNEKEADRITYSRLHLMLGVPSLAGCRYESQTIRDLDELIDNIIADELTPLAEGLETATSDVSKGKVHTSVWELAVVQVAQSVSPTV